MFYEEIYKLFVEHKNIRVPNEELDSFLSFLIKKDKHARLDITVNYKPGITKITTL